MYLENGLKCFLICLTMLVLAGTASGAEVTHFSEDFEEYEMGGSDTNQGIPLGIVVTPPDQDEGAKRTWYGGRFEHYEFYTAATRTIDEDVSVKSTTGNEYAQFKNKAGILFGISTYLVSDVMLSFDWKTQVTPSNGGSLVVGYTLETVNPLGFDEGANRRRDFFADDFGGNNTAAEAWWTGEWTELLRASNGSWQSSSAMLPDDTAFIWVAFWMEGGQADCGEIDNVLVVSGVPEPATLAFLAMGSLSLLRRRRK